jgi:hypothetical protein
LGEISHRANKKGRTKEFLGKKYTKSRHILRKKILKLLEVAKNIAGFFLKKIPIYSLTYSQN